MNPNFYDSNLFIYGVLPGLIFLSRVTDVSFGTIRIVMVSKGQKFWAPFLGFFEILIWLLAISKVFQNLDNWVCYIAYAGGFACGNYVGLCIEERLAVGIAKIQIITRKSAQQLIENLVAAGYGITHHDAKGSTENVSIIYSIVNRKEIEKVQEIVTKTNPMAFYSVEDIKSVNQGIFPGKTIWRRRKSK